MFEQISKRLLPISLVSVIWMSCIKPSSKNEARSLVYEGMSSEDLIEAIGMPERIDTSGEVFDVSAGAKRKIQKWYYEKRLVLMLNDTVKDVNLVER